MGRVYIFDHNLVLTKTTTLGTIRAITGCPTAVLRQIRPQVNPVPIIRDPNLAPKAYCDYTLVSGQDEITPMQAPVFNAPAAQQPPQQPAQQPPQQPLPPPPAQPNHAPLADALQPLLPLAIPERGRQEENEEENPASVTVAHTEVNMALLTVMVSVAVRSYDRHWFRFGVAMFGTVLALAVFGLALYAKFNERHRISANKYTAVLGFAVLVVQILLTQIEQPQEQDANDA